MKSHYQRNFKPVEQGKNVNSAFPAKYSKFMLKNADIGVAAVYKFHGLQIIPPMFLSDDLFYLYGKS